MLCMGHREFGANRWRFLSKANTLYFRLCKICELMMCILIVEHQLNRMHPWSTSECTLPGRCSPGKRCHTVWNRNIVLLLVVMGKVSCVPATTLCELFGVKGLRKIGVELMELLRNSLKMSMRVIFCVPS